MQFLQCWCFGCPGYADRSAPTAPIPSFESFHPFVNLHTYRHTKWEFLSKFHYFACAVTTKSITDYCSTLVHAANGAATISPFLKRQLTTYITGEVHAVYIQHHFSGKPQLPLILCFPRTSFFAHAQSETKKKTFRNSPMFPLGLFNDSAPIHGLNTVEWETEGWSWTVSWKNAWKVAVECFKVIFQHEPPSLTLTALPNKESYGGGGIYLYLAKIPRFIREMCDYYIFWNPLIQNSETT
jgi:hypothetical protein